MKNIIYLMLSILILIVVLDIITYKYLEKTSDNLYAVFNAIKMDIKANKWDDAQNKINSSEKDWQKMSKKWAALIEHREIEEIELNIAKLKSFISTKNKDQSMSILESIQMLIKHIPSNEKLSMENIL
ncbi:MAG: DUF4363 family protein [Thermoanaerobacteraceae bacterium]